MALKTAEIHGRLQQVFRDVLEKDDLFITPQTTQSHIPAWDSMAQVNLILSIEAEFDILFTAQEASEMASVGTILDLIEAKAGRS